MHPSEKRLVRHSEQQRTERSYGRVISLTSVAFGAVGFLLSIGGILILHMKNPPETWNVNIIAGIIFSTAVFYAFGFGIMCLFAPRDFFESDAGQIWLARIGVKSVFAARVACAVYVVFVAIIIAACFYFVLQHVLDIVNERGAAVVGRACKLAWCTDSDRHLG